MTPLIPPAPEPVTAPIDDGCAFPVRRIYCVGRNYADHAREMGSDPDREPPFFFTKPRDAVFTARDVPYPPATTNLHFEVELVLALSAGGVDLDPAAALGCVFGSAVGVDLTRRDLQAEAKNAGRPWDMAKGFDASAPIGLIRPGPAPARGSIGLSVDGEVRQAADLSEMIWTVGETLAHLSRLVTLAPGDLVFTGTPAGVGPVERGQSVSAEIEGLAPLAFTLV